MVDGINGNGGDLWQLSKNLVDKLDAEDGNKDGWIDQSVWNRFVEGKGGKEITYQINAENAGKSIRTYARRFGDAASKIQEWLGAPASGKSAGTPASAQAQAQRTDAGDVSPDEMIKHNKEVERLNKEAQGIIDSANNSVINIDLTFKRITTENLPYILKKEPEFFEKLIDSGNHAPNSIKEAVIELYDKLSGKKLGVKKPTTFEEALQGLKDLANKTPVKEVYSDDTISQAVTAKRESDAAKLKGYVTCPEVTTENSDRVKNLKEQAESIKEQLKNAYKNELGFDNYINILQNTEKDVLAYVLEDEEIQKEFKTKLDVQQLQVLLGKLGYDEDKMPQNKNKCLNILVNTAKTIRNEDAKAVKIEENIKKQNEAKVEIDKALEVLARMANPEPGYEVKKTGRDYGDAQTVQSKLLDSDNNEVNVFRNPLNIVINDTVKITGTTVEHNGITIKDENAQKILDYVQEILDKFK